jgi:GT2 family glycosyltransferase
VTYKSLVFIERCLEPFDERRDIEIVLIENASGDGIADYVRKRFPHVKVVESPENLGFARGNNRAFSHCTGRHILLLNPDAFVCDSGLVDRLADVLESNAKIGAVGPKLINADGSHQVGDAGWRIGLGTVLAHAFMAQRLLIGIPSLYLTHRRLLDRDQVHVDWVCGACMMVRDTVVTEVGGMDEKIFMYGEDIEWGTRIRDAGWQVIYLPKFAVLHLQGASQKGDAELFFSTKWLDDAAARYALLGSRSGYMVLKTGLFMGYSLRAALWITAGILSRRLTWRNKGVMSWRYARHALALPAFVAQHGKA